jgi:hypothetical protein
MSDVATIRPIQTPFAGRLFRSRLEARWAVFYTALGIPWMYEPEGFALADDLRYLPDFYRRVTSSSSRRRRPTRSSARRHCWPCSPRSASSSSSDSPAITATAAIRNGQLAEHGAYLYNGGWDRFYTWCVCPSCGLVGIQFDGRSERLPCRWAGPQENRNYTYNDPRLLAAYDRANRARFTR